MLIVLELLHFWTCTWSLLCFLNENYYESYSYIYQFPQSWADNMPVLLGCHKMTWRRTKLSCNLEWNHNCQCWHFKELMLENCWSKRYLGHSYLLGNVYSELRFWTKILCLKLLFYDSFLRICFLQEYHHRNASVVPNITVFLIYCTHVNHPDH